MITNKIWISIIEKIDICEAIFREVYESYQDLGNGVALFLACETIRKYLPETLNIYAHAIKYWVPSIQQN